MLEELQDILKSVENPIERKLFFLGWLNRQLKAFNVKDFPVLAGGSAVSLYTAGNYSSVDIDLCYSSAHFDSILLPIVFFKRDDIGYTKNSILYWNVPVLITQIVFSVLNLRMETMYTFHPLKI